MADRRRHVSYPPEHVARRKAGERICVWCGKPLPSRAKSWCGQDCVLDYQIARLDQGAARELLLRRHRAAAVQARPWMMPGRAAESHPMPCELCGIDMCDAAVTRRASDPNHENGPCRAIRWEADHIVPIAEGGPATRDNLRVLCRPCHVRVTAEMRARLAAKRKQEKP